MPKLEFDGWKNGIHLFLLFVFASTLLSLSLINSQTIEQQFFILSAVLVQLFFYFTVLYYLFSDWKPRLKTKIILFAIATIIFVFFALLNLTTPQIGSFESSSAIYILLALLTSMMLLLEQSSKGGFTLSWGRADLKQGLIYMSALYAFIFFMSVAFMFISPEGGQSVENAPFLGVPFTASIPLTSVWWVKAIVFFSAGFIEGSFFLTILGFIYRQVTLRFDVGFMERIILIGVLAIMMGFVTSYLHTGLYDVSQEETLGYIFIYFMIASIVTMWLETIFPACVAQGLIDATKGVASTGEIFIFYAMIAVIIGIGVVASISWLSEKKTLRLSSFS